MKITSTDAFRIVKILVAKPTDWFFPWVGLNGLAIQSQEPVKEIGEYKISEKYTK